MIKRIALLGLMCVLAVSTLAAELAEGTPAFEEILKIDVHAHIWEEMPEFMAMMDRINLHIVNVCVKGTQPEILEPRERQAEYLHRTYPRYFSFASTYDLTRRNEPDYAEQVCAWLDKSYAAGATMTKLWKDVGMEIKTESGAYVMPDDPVFDPIYQHIRDCGRPLLAHLAEPIAAWLPLDPASPHYGYYSSNPEWHVYQREGFPSHAQILAARDRLLEKYPRLTVIGAHCGSMSHDVDEIAKRLDRYPNFFIDVSARTKDLAFQSTDKVRRFFITYQDRILYGVDLGRPDDPDKPSSPADRLRFVRQTEDRYRQEYLFYAGAGKVRFDQRDCECLALPREVLEKFYHKNAQRLLPDLQSLSADVEPDDPYPWLEEVDGERALDWGRQKNAATLDVLKTPPAFEAIQQTTLANYNAKERIASALPLPHRCLLKQLH